VIACWSVKALQLLRCSVSLHGSEAARQQEREQSPCQDEKIQNSAEVSELDEASDLFRQHSHQQSMEGG
jgi:hypothetical protein